ncbi:hypothetical protein ARMGADRAFT_1168638 [Armillaria gallica]|uniref:Uncharacterized protein n=1 Tax=Armillaria gallica TaxID=47427 RepID=A0A2H3D0L1_ARMGA|nr:hypothetical protein ARMGADRAFT_1168638 [Armillaria gallica]
MESTRDRDDESISKHLNLAKPLLGGFKNILEQTPRPLERHLAIVQLIVLNEDAAQDEKTTFEFSQVTQAILETRFGVRFSHHDWSPHGILSTAMSSKYRDDSLESLFHDLEIISVFSPIEGDAVHRIVTAYLLFITSSINKNREIQIKTAIKARIESDADFDIMSLMPLGFLAEKLKSALSLFVKKAGLPESTFSELSIDDKAEFIRWSNYLVAQNGLVDLEGYRNSCCIRLFPGINLDGLGAPLYDQNGRKLVLYGVVDYAMFVYKTLDDECVRSAGCYDDHGQLSQAESVEARLIFIETKIDENGHRRPVGGEPLVEASAQALALSAQLKISNVRYVVTNSEDWVVAHLHNPLDGGAPEVVSYLCEMCPGGNPHRRLYEDILVRDEEKCVWRNQVRTIHAMLMEWLLPEDMSAIPSPPLSGKEHDQVNQ